MEWSWTIFFLFLPFAGIFSMLSRGAMNAQNVAQHGPAADFRGQPGKAIFGSIMAGAVWAAITTVIVGLV